MAIVEILFYFLFNNYRYFLSYAILFLTCFLTRKSVVISANLA